MMVGTKSVLRNVLKNFQGLGFPAVVRYLHTNTRFFLVAFYDTRQSTTAIFLDAEWSDNGTILVNTTHGCLNMTRFSTTLSSGLLVSFRLLNDSMLWIATAPHVMNSSVKPLENIINQYAFAATVGWKAATIGKDDSNSKVWYTDSDSLFPTRFLSLEPLYMACTCLWQGGIGKVITRKRDIACSC